MVSLEVLQHVHDQQKTVDIIAQCSTHYQQIGNYLLHDRSGAIVESLELKRLSDPVKILRDIFGKWLREDRECSWEKLIECLRRFELNNITNDVEDALGIQPAQGLH